MQLTTPHTSGTRRLITGGALAALMLTGLAAPTQAAAADCSSFSRAKVISKVEILTPVASGELRNSTSIEQELFIERSVSDTRSTSKEYRADWALFEKALTVGVSSTVTEEHTIAGLQRHAMKVAPHRVYVGTANVRTWRVETEVTKRNGSCEYDTWRITGDVATTDEVVWTTRDAGMA